MGPKQSTEGRSKEQQFLSNYQIIQEIPNESIRFLQHKQTKKQYLLRELSYNDKKQYTKAIGTIQTKKQQLKDADHVTPIVQYFQKQQDQYCSTFYKLYVLFQYPQRTLDDQINERNLRKNSFSQTQLWSILASCILGLSHLQRKGIKHGSLKSNMIFLSQEGHIKVSDPFTTGCQNNYQTLLNKRLTRHIYLSPQQCQALQSQTISTSNINQYKSDIFTLGMIILQCGLLQYQDQCYRDQYSRIHFETLQYNKNRFRRIYSDQLGNMLDYMLGTDVNSRPQWIQLQNYVITDNMGKSFISEGRRSAIIGYSKPVSVNTNSKFNVGSQALHQNINLQNNNNLNGHNSSSEIQKTTQQKSSNSVFTTNKGIGISSSKPVSIQKNYNKTTNPGSMIPNRKPQFIFNQHLPNLNTINSGIEPISKIIKPHSVVSNPTYNSSIPTNANHFFINNYQHNLIPNLPLNLPSSGSNFPSSVSNLPNFSKPYITQSPIKNQLLTKNYDIPPVSISNISNTRPLRSIFPNPFYQTKTKVDQNLVQMEDDQQTSRTTSQISRFQSVNNESGLKKVEKEQFFQGANQKYNPNIQNLGIYNHQFSNNAINKNISTFTNSVPDYQARSHISNAPNFIQQQMHSNPVHSQSFQNQGEFVMQTFKLGSRYEGYKLNGMRHGPGKFFYQDGGMYDGNWVKNKMQGYGKLYYQSGKIAYDGNWVKDQFTGYGILYNQNPDRLDQPFDYQNFDNVQQLWTKYEGQFSQDSKNGKGILYLSNGEYFKGNFVNDTAEGEGIYTSMDGRKIRGLWSNNLLVEQF